MPRVSIRLRSRFRAFAFSVTLLSGAAWLPVTPTSAYQKPNEALADPENKSLSTKDGGTIHITYYASGMGKDSPVVVLLHMKDGNRFIWQGDKGFAPRLQQDGYAVITVDLRHHGESKDGAAPGANLNQADKKKGSKKQAANDLKPADYKAMVEYDLEAVKKFIYEEHQAENLNMNKLGIVGPEMGASVAAVFAAFDWAKTPYPDGQPGFQTPRGQDVRALVLISPQTSFHGLAISPAVADLRDQRLGVAFLVCGGENDPQDRGQVKKIFDQAAALPNSEKRMYKYVYKGKLRGTDLLGKGLGIEEHMLAFFAEHLKKLDSPWRDRQSKLDKKK
jgi:pimeloyl-ACP methyl ester carboxylesterase